MWISVPVDSLIHSKVSCELCGMTCGIRRPPLPCGTALSLSMPTRSHLSEFSKTTQVAQWRASPEEVAEELGRQTIIPD